VTIGSSIFMIVVGAILRYAITFHVHGLNLPALGLILTIVGIVTLVLRLVWIFNPGLGGHEPPAPARPEPAEWADAAVPAAPRAERRPPAPVPSGPNPWPHDYP
jgi:hypothetical protein